MNITIHYSQIRYSNNIISHLYIGSLRVSYNYTVSIGLVPIEQALVPYRTGTTLYK